MVDIYRFIITIIADWHSQFLLLRFCSITRGRWLPRVMPARMIQEYIAR